MHLRQQVQLIFRGFSVIFQGEPDKFPPNSERAIQRLGQAVKITTKSSPMFIVSSKFKLTANIALIGPMGSGKSTLGKLLSRRLDVPFVDTDKIIEDKTGVDIPTIFDIEGEKGFRDRETKVLEEVSANPPQVISTGGGIVIRPENREILRQNTYAVYLLVPPDQLIARLKNDTTRPLLQTANPEEVILRIMHERDPFYRATAHWVLPTDHLPVMKVNYILFSQLIARGIIQPCAN